MNNTAMMSPVGMYASQFIPAMADMSMPGQTGEVMRRMGRALEAVGLFPGGACDGPRVRRMAVSR